MKWKARYLLVAESLYEFAAGLFGPIYAIFVAQIGGDILTAGWAWALFAIVTGVTLYVMGLLGDRIKRDEWMVIIGFTLASFGFLGYLFVSAPWHLFVVQAILGFGWAFGTPAIDTIYSKNLDRGKTDSQWGLWEASIRIVEGVSAFIGGIIAFLFGFRILFLIMFGISVVAIFIVSSLMRAKKRKASH
ncbi:MFS transporter [Candidatus Woesearchaeota archaeon]|nr:MFS transporter [Candidatus Woesearchaeota archaeon]